MISDMEKKKERSAITGAAIEETKSIVIKNLSIYLISLI
jgi:hypothetical protein